MFWHHSWLCFSSHPYLLLILLGVLIYMVSQVAFIVVLEPSEGYTNSTCRSCIKSICQNMWSENLRTCSLLSFLHNSKPWWNSDPTVIWHHLFIYIFSLQSRQKTGWNPEHYAKHMSDFSVISHLDFEAFNINSIVSNDPPTKTHKSF